MQMVLRTIGIENAFPFTEFPAANIFFTVHWAHYVKVRRPYVESTPITRIGISNVPKTKSPTPGGMFASLIGKANRLARMMLKENEAKTAAKKARKKTRLVSLLDRG